MKSSVAQMKSTQPRTGGIFDTVGGKRRTTQILETSQYETEGKIIESRKNNWVMG